MPRFCGEPRPYRLIRAQKQNPFFLARAAAISPLQIPATTRASCHHHASLLPPPRSFAAVHHRQPRTLLETTTAVATQNANALPSSHTVCAAPSELAKPVEIITLPPKNSTSNFLICNTNNATTVSTPFLQEIHDAAVETPFSRAPPLQNALLTRTTTFKPPCAATGKHHRTRSFTHLHHEAIATVREPAARHHRSSSTPPATVLYGLGCLENRGRSALYGFGS